MSTSIYVPSADEFTGSNADYGMLSEDEIGRAHV